MLVNIYSLLVFCVCTLPIATYALHHDAPLQYSHIAVTNVEAVSPFVTKLTIASSTPPLFSYRMIKHPNGRCKPYVPYHVHTSYDMCELLVKTSSSGIVSKYLSQVKCGDTLCCSLPILKHNAVDILSHDHIGLIVGGVGVASALQVLETLLQTGHQVSLLYAVDFAADFCYLSYFQELAKQYTSFTFSTIVRYPPSYSSSCSTYTGVVTEDIIQQCMPAQHLHPYIGVSGPQSFAEMLLGRDGLLSRIGYKGGEI